MNIRKETQQDYKEVEELVKKAFLSAKVSDGDEHHLVERIRASEDFVPELTYVVENSNGLVGHIMFSEVKIEDDINERIHTSLALAPISVLPEYQNQGIGKQMVREAIEKAKELGYGTMLALGNPEYYSKFGFRKAKIYDVVAPFKHAEDYFLILELQPDALKGLRGNALYSRAFFPEK
ncbi:MAG: N-acetyltransferase [Alphaproteobacteria bacterium]|nr:N-acetyltransferase [Alphaproteobacteria bacterium]